MPVYSLWSWKRRVTNKYIQDNGDKEKGTSVEKRKKQKSNDFVNVITKLF